MLLGPSQLIDPCLLPLADASLAFYANRGARRGPSSLEELLLVRAAAKAPEPSDPPAAAETATAYGRTVGVRIHTPSGPATGAVLQLRGGGFYMGTAADDDVRNSRLARALGAAVVSADYRLAPEHPWPAAPDDCETSALWLADQAAERFGTTALSIVGFSAGATLALTTLLRLRDRGRRPFSSAVLQFGTYDLSAATPAGRLISDEYFLAAYCGDALDRTHPDISPLFADLADLADLPPLLLVVGQDDVLLHDNLALAARLAACGADVDVRVFPSCPHGSPPIPRRWGR